MNLIDKLALSERQGMISLIKEGIFFRCYEQSLFSLIHLHYPTLAVRGRSFKNLKGLVANNKLARFLLRVHWMFQAKTVSTLNNRFIKADRSRTRNLASPRRNQSSN